MPTTGKYQPWQRLVVPQKNCFAAWACWLHAHAARTLEPTLWHQTSLLFFRYCNKEMNPVDSSFLSEEAQTLVLSIVMDTSPVTRFECFVNDRQPRTTNCSWCKGFSAWRILEKSLLEILEQLKPRARLEDRPQAGYYSYIVCSDPARMLLATSPAIEPFSNPTFGDRCFLQTFM